MNRHGFALLALAIIAIAGWAYNVNYNTMTKLDRLDELRSEIAKERETLRVLRIEWAYLNAPDRLAGLVRRHNAQLGLIPMTPEVFGHVAAVPFARDDALPEVRQASEPEAGQRTVPIPPLRPASWRTGE